MGNFAKRRFEDPDDTREFEHGKVDVVHLSGSTAVRSTFEARWRWSTDIKPKVGTETCQAHHIGYCVSGALHVVTEEGNEFDLAPGDVYEISLATMLGLRATPGLAALSSRARLRSSSQPASHIRTAVLAT